LLHLFFLPFAVAAYLGSQALFFVPNVFPVLLCTIQVAMLNLAALMFSRLLRLQGPSKIAFLTLFAVSFSVMIHALTFDGFIVSTFWLACFLYLFSERKNNCDYAYVAAAGTLLTTGILILLYLRISKWKENIIRIVHVFVFYVTLWMVFGSRSLVAFLINWLAPLQKFIGKELSFYEKFSQYINFIASFFVKPKTIITPTPSTSGTWITCWLAPVESLNPLGLLLLSFCALGFVLNYKDRFAKICAFWIAFSFCVLCLGGWGTALNEMILYSLYFGWAYFCLTFLAIEKLLQNLPQVKYAVYVVLIAVLAWINIPGIYDLVQFGVKYYPCQ